MSATLRVRAALVLMLSVPAVANASTMALAWNANPESNLAGYILVYGTSSGNYSNSIDVGNNISYSVGALTAGTRYYFAVRAYNTTGATGPLSSEVNDIAADAPPPPPPPPPPSLLLVAAYSFGEASGSVATDKTANNNDGTLSGGAVRTAAGRFGRALVFDGINGLVTIPSALSLDFTSAFSLEAWISPTLSDDWRTVLMKETPTGHTYVLYSNSGTTGPSAHAQTSSDRTATAAALPPLNIWTHVAAVSDGTTLRLYVNGQQTASVSVLAALVSSTGPVQIGGNLVWGEYFVGTIDEVRMYRGALTAAQIQQDMITPIDAADGADATKPTVSITSPAAGASITGSVSVTATAADNVAIAGVRFELDGSSVGAEDLTAPYALTWNSTGATNGSHALTAIARDTAGNLQTSAAVSVTVFNDSVLPTVSITSPAGGASITGSVSITATAADNVAVAGVRFLLDGSSAGVEDLTAPYALTWNSTTAPNGSHALTAIARDTSGNLRTSAAVTVTVSNDSGLPTVSITSPAGGASIAGTVTITAAAADNVAVAGVRFLLDGSGIGAEDLTAPYALAWDFSSVPNGSHALTAIARDTTGNLQTSAAVSVTVSNDSVLPTVSITSPAGDASIAGTVTITATAADDVAVAGVRFLLDGSGIGAEDLTAPYALAWDFNSVPSGSHTLTAIARDTAGNQQTSAVVSVTVTNDTVAPTVMSASPANGSSTVSLTANVTATFSEAIRAATLTTTTFVLRDAANALVPAVVSYNATSRVGTLNPSAPLTAATTYTATITGGDAGVQDAAGNPLASNFVRSFTTVLPDTTSPAVTGVTPADGATGVSLATTVTATFSEPMAAASITAVNFQLRNAAGIVLPSAVTYNSTARKATLTPSAPLPPGGTYDATVKGGTGGVRDVAGNVATTNTVWSFSVVTPVSTGPVAAYGFDEGTGSTLTDLSGNQLHGTIRGATWQSGRFGQSLAFDGVSNWVTIPANTLLNFTAAVTIEAWVYPTAQAGWHTAVFKETPTGHTYALYSQGSEGDSVGPTGHMQVALDHQAQQAGPLPLGQWSHLATTYDGQSVRLFVNAVQVASVAASGPLEVSNGVLRIGGNSLWGEHFSGRIDEVRIYNRALGAGELAADMGTPASGWLAAAYGFDETAGSTAADASGRQLTGTVINATWTTGRFGNGLAFNGVNSSVVVPHNPWLNLTTGMTLEAWVYPTDGGGWRTVMLKETADGHTFALYSDGNATPGAHLQAAADVIAEGTVPVPLQTWTHLASTYDGASLHLYVNGVLTSTTAVTGVPITSTLPLRIGGNTIWGEYFAGVIDEVRIYYRALTAAEIAADMTKPVR